jgi:hypothetical protein
LFSIITSSEYQFLQSNDKVRNKLSSLKKRINWSFRNSKQDKKKVKFDEWWTWDLRKCSFNFKKNIQISGA